MNISIKVIPNSKNLKIIKINEKSYKIKIDAPAFKNKANKRLIKILSKYFKVSRYSISIVKGFKSKNKIIKIDI